MVMITRSMSRSLANVIDPITTESSTNATITTTESSTNTTIPVKKINKLLTKKNFIFLTAIYLISIIFK